MAKSKKTYTPFKMKGHTLPGPNQNPAFKSSPTKQLSTLAMIAGIPLLMGKMGKLQGPSVASGEYEKRMKRDDEHSRRIRQEQEESGQSPNKQISPIGEYEKPDLPEKSKLPEKNTQKETESTKEKKVKLTDKQRKAQIEEFKKIEKLLKNKKLISEQKKFVNPGQTKWEGRI